MKYPDHLRYLFILVLCCTCITCVTFPLAWGIEALLVGCSSSVPPPAVVLVEHPTVGVWGNGFYVRDDLIVTVKHLVLDPNNIKVDGQAARVVYLDSELDLALLEVKTSTVEPSVKFSRANLRPLQLVRCLSKVLLPRNTQLEVQGRVAAVDVKNEFFGTGPVDYLDITAQPGFSGSPVLDGDNRVVGIVVGGTWNFTISIPLTEELVLWPRLE